LEGTDLLLLQSSTANLLVLLSLLEADLLLWPLLANELSVLPLLFEEVNMLLLLEEVNELLLLLKKEVTDLYQGLAAVRMLLWPQGLAAGRILLWPTMRRKQMLTTAIWPMCPTTGLMTVLTTTMPVSNSLLDG
jgi:hypothetical protein